jgi:hypothetical protein
MADISRLTRLVSGIYTDINLSQNTLVVQNLKINLGGPDHVTFAGPITDVRTINVADEDVDLGHINSLNTLSGVSPGSVDLGMFPGSTIPDDSTIKEALEALETAVESGSAASEEVEYRTITSGEATAKTLTLSETPSDPTKVKVFAVGGPVQIYGVDFSVVGDALTWNGLGLDGILDAGDVLVIIYNF